MQSSTAPAESRIKRRFGQLASEICADGSMLPASALQDIKVFLENLESAGFITSAEDEELVEQQATQIADFSGNPAQVGFATRIAAFCIGVFLRASSLTQLFAAYWAIATADLIIKVGGFRALHRAVRNWPVSSYAAGQLTPEEILSAVDKASASIEEKRDAFSVPAPLFGCSEPWGYLPD